MKKSAASLCLLGLLASCSGSGQTASPPPEPTTAQGRSNVLVADSQAGVDTSTPSNAHAPRQRIINVFMFQMLLPYGAISRNAAFWKLVQEDAVDVASYDLLYKNGIRVGRGRVDAWPRFREIIDQGSTVYQPSKFTGVSNDDVQLDMAPQMDDQTLFIFDEHGVTGRSFNLCRNRFAFRFMWEPHLKDTIRVKICPVVVALRKRFDYTMSDDPPETPFTEPEHLYDLRLAADIRPGEFLVIGPSPDADDSNRVGHRFLTMEGATDRFEQLLVLVGESMPFEKAHLPTTQPSATTQKSVKK